MKRSLRIAALLSLVLILSGILSGAGADRDGWYCPRCGRYNEADYGFCPKDGVQKPAYLNSGDVVEIMNTYTEYASVWAVSNARLATRTGPGTWYDEPGSFNKAGESYRVLSKAYDSSNGIWWVQVEINSRGAVYWAYTGVKRFSNLNLNQIPEERPIGRCTTRYSTEAWYAPVPNGAVMKRKVPVGVYCDIYGYVEGSGADYILIEFFDPGLKCTRRAWVQDPTVDDYVMYNGF